MAACDDVKHRNMLVRDVLSSDPSDCQVSVCGVVVDIVSPNIELHSNRPLVLSVDDGTGVVKCAMFGHYHHSHLRDISLGQCCLVRGTVTQYMNQTQIKCEVIKLVTDVNFETLWINKVLYEKRYNVCH